MYSQRAAPNAQLSPSSRTSYGVKRTLYYQSVDCTEHDEGGNGEFAAERRACRGKMAGAFLFRPAALKVVSFATTVHRKNTTKRIVAHAALFHRD
jgi:hypothetical protein